jgi:menaquinone-dependent protoporphyrinogen oxidase
MRVLVAYATHFGATKGIAEKIAESIRGEGLTVDLKSVDEIQETDGGYDAFVVGSAVHAGHWLKPAAEFVERNADVLGTRPVWLFSSGPIGEKYVHAPQPDPKEVARFRELLEPRDHVVFAGAFDREVAKDQGSWLDRTVGRFIPEGDFRDWPQIERWARTIARDLTPVAATAYDTR